MFENGMRFAANAAKCNQLGVGQHFCSNIAYPMIGTPVSPGPVAADIEQSEFLALGQFV